MRVALLVFVLSIALVQVSAQQASSAATPEEPLPRERIPQNSPCANQPRSLSELTESFNKGRVASANCTGIMRGKKFEFAMIGESYDRVMELHAIEYEIQRVRMEPNHRGSMEFYVDLLADGAEEVYTCRLTQRRTLACVNVMRGWGSRRKDPTSGEEFKRMKVADSQLFNGLEP